MLLGFSLSKVKKFYIFSVSEGGRGCISSAFPALSREGNFGLHSTPPNYSSLTVCSPCLATLYFYHTNNLLISEPF